MAVTVTAAANYPQGTAWDIIATLDADTTAVVTHNFNSVAVVAFIMPLLQAPASVSEWAVTTIAANAITLTKGVGVGSGNAGAQVRVFVAPYQAVFFGLIPRIG